MKSSHRSPSILFFFLATSIFTFISAQTTYQGCYAVDDNLVANDTNIYQSAGRCSGIICGPKKYAVYGLTSASQCWCGNSIPTEQVSPDHCELTCPGYPSDNCTPFPWCVLMEGGGTGYISVWLTGVGKLVGNAATSIISTDTSTSKPTKTGGSRDSSPTVYITAGGRTFHSFPR
jgi:hypothetical protein